MEFIVFLLAVWIFAEWMMRRSDRDKNDQLFSNVISILNRAEKDFQELKRLTTRVSELENQVATRGVETSAPNVPPPPTVAPEMPSAAGFKLSPTATPVTAGHDSSVTRTHSVSAVAPPST